MKKMRVLGVFVFALLLLSVAVLSQYALQPGEDPMQALLKDPVVAELMAYDEAADEVRGNPSPATRLAHCQEWKERIQNVLDENPQSQFAGSARVKLLGLYNGLKEYDKSQALLQELIAEAKTPEEKIGWQNELGTISMRRSLDSQDQNELKKAQEAFEEANKLYLSLSPEKQKGPLGGEQIDSLFTAAVAAREANDHEKSATLFRSARELFQSSTECAAHAAMIGYDLEVIAEREMNQWITLRKESDALRCLEILSKLPSFRWCPSLYALNYATMWYVNNSKGFQDFVSQWLDENSFDERTPILMARLGFSYFDDGLYDMALPIYETLREKHRGDFQRLEPKAFEQGNGGHYERVLHDLFKIYSQRGDKNKADNMRTELTTLLPDSALGKLLSPIKPLLEDWTPPERDRPRYLALRITCIVVGIVLILWGLYLAWTEKKKET